MNSKGKDSNSHQVNKRPPKKTKNWVKKTGKVQRGSFR